MSQIGVNEQTPREIVAELDKYIVGQHEAKRSVAIALRNRWRSRQLDDEMREDVIPKNILMIGSTGVGKTEIARRLARLVRAPFLKVEATKFTEVGYVGRDVESIVRDLVETAVRMVRQQKIEDVPKKLRTRSAACSPRTQRRSRKRRSRRSIRRDVSGCASVSTRESWKAMSSRSRWRSPRALPAICSQGRPSRA